MHGWFSRMDLIGGYVLQGGNTTWRDGIVLRAIKNGRKTLILLDEINISLINNHQSLMNHENKAYM